jgi:hypothetical protein
MRIFVALSISITASLLLAWAPVQGSPSSSPELRQSLAVVGVCAQQQAFQVDLQPDSGDGPHFMLRNFCDAPLTAIYLQVVSPDDGKVQGGQVWDGLMQRQPPIAKGGSASLQLAHVAGKPFSSKIEVGAAVWSDGSTFGNPELLRNILSFRAAELRSYERAISFLKRGLERNWTRDEYIAAWEQQKQEAPTTSVAFVIMESNIQRNPSVESPDNLRRVMERLMQTFTEKRDLLRQSKPDPEAVDNPN